VCFFNKKKKEILNPECVEFCKELDIAIGAANSYFSNPCLYIDESTADLWLEKYAYLIEKTEKNNVRRFRGCRGKKDLDAKIAVFKHIPGTLRDNLQKHNSCVAAELECNSLCESYDIAVREAESYFINGMQYIDMGVAEIWRNKYAELNLRADRNYIRRLIQCSRGKELQDKATKFLSVSKTFESNIINHNKRVALEIECRKMCEEIDYAVSEERNLFSNPDQYIDVTEADAWIQKYSNLLQRISAIDLQHFKGCSRENEFTEKKQQLLFIPNTVKSKIICHNDDLAKRQIDEGYRIIGTVEGQTLDRQQMFAIVKPSKNHLIIAGAGTGKTTTIVGKIKYLLKKGLYKPEEILVLSFTNASAAEMSERINKEAGVPIAASTFHKLGLEIIKSVEEKVPKIYSKSVSSFVKEKLQELMRDANYLNKLCDYALYYKNAIRTENDFSSDEEYQDYLSSNTPTTLKGEEVKSYGELDIANFLYQNQVSYEYEASYRFDTNTSEYGQYHPDFYLPDYDIYIEYFGINREGNVADYFRAKDGFSASETYQAGMEWKRKTHLEMQTTMVECYAYEKFEGNLLSNLETKLKEKSVVLKPLSTDELWSRITEENDGLTDGIIELFGTIISLIKSNNYSFDYVESLAATHTDVMNNLYVLSLIKPIYNAYDSMLESAHEIDFSDMINKATAYVSEGKYRNPYKFVIVDEYQDISKARFNLLNELRKSSFYELFCVGDDWQSIYRFAGSDINYIVDFENYWGSTEIGRIETTYRFTDSLIEISSDFIMQNPRQIKKSIRGKSYDREFSLGEVKGYTEKYAIQFMVERLDDLPNSASVYFIGRYSFDINILKENSNFKFSYDNVNSETIVTYYRRPDLKMRYMTAHRSKGLQAEYVFIINNKNSRMGFPSKIQDASIMDLLLEKAEIYPYAEERRLFYVALTRAKKKVFLVTVENRESIFAKELLSKYKNQISSERFTCPECGGRLIKKSGPYGDFFGCSNYAKTGCTYKRKINKQ